VEQKWYKLYITNVCECEIKPEKKLNLFQPLGISLPINLAVIND